MKVGSRALQFLLAMILTQLVAHSHAAGPQRLEPGNTLFQHILGLTLEYYRAWSYTSEDTVFDQAGEYYAGGADNVYWDPLPPLEGYRGWSEYKNVIATVWKPSGMQAAGILFAHDGSFQAWRHGEVVWTTGNCLVSAQHSNGSTSTMPCRGTQVWTREGDSWLVAHEHFSSTITPDASLFQGKRKPDAKITVNRDFLQRAKEHARNWTASSLDNSSSSPGAYYPGGDTRLYMPWPPHDGYPNWSSMSAGLSDYLGLLAKEIKLTINEDLETHQMGEVTWTTATVNLQFDLHDGRQTAGRGRQSLIWIRQDGKWLIAHEHLSLPLNKEATHE